MSTSFQRGDPVRRIGEDREMVVEGYDADGRVICSFWEGIVRDCAPFLEMDLEKIPLPPLPAA